MGKLRLLDVETKKIKDLTSVFYGVRYYPMSILGHCGELEIAFVKVSENRLNRSLCTESYLIQFKLKHNEKQAYSS